MNIKNTIDSNVTHALSLAEQTYIQFINIGDADNLVRDRAAVGAATSATAGLVYIQFSKHLILNEPDTEVLENLFDTYEQFVDYVHLALATNLGYEGAIKCYENMKTILAKAGYTDWLFILN